MMDQEHIDTIVDRRVRRALAISGIPKHLHEGVLRYVVRRVMPGAFLQAVFRNNLAEAVGRADAETIEYLPAIVRFIYSHAPAVCWGSDKAVGEWTAGNEEQV
jgi:hypothetical protein